MRFHFVSHPTTQLKSGEEIAKISFRDAYHKDQNDPSIDVTWRRKEGADWQNPDVALTGTPEIVLEKARILRGLTGFVASQEKLKLDDPDALLVAMEREGALQVAFVAQKRQFQPIKYIDPAAINWKAMVDGRGIIVVEAAEEEEAQREAGKRLLALVSGDEVDVELADKFAAWLKLGRPVQKQEQKDGVEIHPLDVYCRRGHQRKAAEKKAGVTETASHKKPVIKGATK